MKHKHIQWQKPSDFWRERIFYSKKAFDAIILVRKEERDLAQKKTIFYDTLHILRMTYNGSICTNAVLDKFELKEFDIEEYTGWALIDYKYTKHLS